MLTLDVDQLEVTSFATAPVGYGADVVRLGSELEDLSLHRGCPTWNFSCDGTCHYSCGGTCLYPCEPGPSPTVDTVGAF